MKVIRVAMGADERDVPLEGTLTVGRDPRCEIRDDDPELSRRHAEFAVEPRGVVVRDLNSRNGIRVNGVRVDEALLRPGDVVQAAKLRMKYVDDTPEEDTQAPADDTEDHTVLMSPAGVAPGPAASRAPRVGAADGPSPRGVGGGPGQTAPIQIGGARSSPPAPPKPAGARGRSASWGGWVLILTLGLALVVFFMTWVPMSTWQGRVLNETAVARATALANWLAAETASSLAARGKGLPDVGARVEKQPGVVAYLVVSTKGEVWAPAARARQTVAKLPGFGVPPSEIFRLQSKWNGDLLEVALPVAVGDDPRAAVAALTFRPSALPGGSSSAILLAPLLLAALVLGWLVAISLRRRTLGALTRFNEDVDLMLAGQLPAVLDPMGTKPTKDLADLVNHLASRLRAGEAGPARAASDDAARPPRVERPGGNRGAGAAPSRGREAPDAPARPSPSAPAARECEMVASPTFRVVEASPACRGILGIQPEAVIGQHVLDAIPDRVVLDAILKSFSKLPPAGEERVTVAPETRPFRLSILVARSGKDQPITIAFTVVDGERA